MPEGADFPQKQATGAGTHDGEAMDKRLLIVLALVGVGFLWHLSKPRNRAAKKAPPVERQLAKVPESERIRKGNLATRSLRKARARGKMSVELGVQSLPLARKPMTFAMVPVPADCATGDYDLILMDVARRKGTGLMVVLESLSEPGRNGKKRSRKVKPRDFARGLNLAFDLKKYRKPDLLGLYICSTGRSGNSCADKKIIDFSRTYTNYLNKKKGGKNHLYYFQTLLLTKDSLSTVNGQFMRSASPKKLQAWIKAMAPGLRVSGKSIKKIMKTNRKLGSVPPQIVDHQIRLELPYSKPICKLPGIAELRRTFPGLPVREVH